MPMARKIMGKVLNPGRGYNKASPRREPWGSVTIISSALEGGDTLGFISAAPSGADVVYMMIPLAHARGYPCVVPPGL